MWRVAALVAALDSSNVVSGFIPMAGWAQALRVLPLILSTERLGRNMIDLGSRGD